MTLPEAAARANIDRQLERAGWCVQDREAVNLHAARGVAVREVPLGGGYGKADYLLFVDGGAAGVVEAKAEGATLTGVELQSKKYGDGVPSHFKAAIRPLPFLYESTGAETRFTNGLDPESRSRAVFSFHRPETLALWSAGGVAVRLAHEAGHGKAPLTTVHPPGYGVGSENLRRGLCELPPLEPDGLWPAQHRAIRNLERSLAENRPRALIQMATGSGILRSLGEHLATTPVRDREGVRRAACDAPVRRVWGEGGAGRGKGGRPDVLIPASRSGCEAVVRRRMRMATSPATECLASGYRTASAGLT